MLALLHRNRTSLPLPAAPQVDRVLGPGNRNTETDLPIPEAEPGRERSYLYLDT